MLRADGRDWAAGELPAGTYEIWAAFDDTGPRLQGTATLAEGASRSIRCDALFEKCVTR